jgi:hypothetical protein
MVPHVTPDQTDRADVLPTAASPLSPSPREEDKPLAASELADAEAQAPEMAWTATIMIGTALLLVSAGLGIAMALHIDFAEWLFFGVLLVLVIVEAANVIDRAMLQTLTLDELRAER